MFLGVDTAKRKPQAGRERQREQELKTGLVLKLLTFFVCRPGHVTRQIDQEQDLGRSSIQE